MVLMHFQCFIWSTHPLPCLGSCCRHRDCLSLARWRKECKILGIGLEFGTQKFTRCVLGKENFSMCLIGCWCLFGFPQPQKSLIPSTEWMWRLTQCAESIQVQGSEENKKYHPWEARWALCNLILQPRVSLPCKELH